MAAMCYIQIVTCLLCLIAFVNCWTNEDFEIFDLVEEVGQNFYDLLKLDQSASNSEIRKAYRKLSLQYHPDKNKDHGAEEFFRKIVAVSEVLRDDEKRKKYDLILQNGLPDWRQPVFYYRRVRKMGLWELAFFLCVLLTLGQYLVAWSIYWEKKYELEEVFISRFRRRERKARKSKQGGGEESLLAEHISNLPRPRYQDLLPIRLVSFLFYLIKSAPMFYQQWREMWLERPKTVIEDSEEGTEASEKFRRTRKKIKPELPDYSCIFQPVDGPCTGSSESEESSDTRSKENGSDKEKASQEWTENDKLNLTKAMNKFPGGTSMRWEKIAQLMNRSVEDVTTVAKQMKTSTFTPHVHHALQGLTGLEQDLSQNTLLVDTTQADEDDDNGGPVKRRLVKDSKDVPFAPKQIPLHCAEETTNLDKDFDANWKQQQQKALELALQQFPKGTDERWDKIAECVPGKNKEECIQRYKSLVELVKKKKTTKIS